MKDFDISISLELKNSPSENVNLVALNKWIGSTQMCGSLDYAHPTDLLKEAIKTVENQKNNVQTQ